ncbi:tumor necrosis factor receptor superfamily member 6B [Eucyclogobius newberryi]|uniref:tumor necrosis factor receptor superfamily member 6B n=1 Tax=Eucyclogobius newberryi TaxID=166745 RepID=UPI003B59BCB2
MTFWKAPLWTLLWSVVLSSENLSVNSVELTFRGVDPVSGAELSCLQCPPGKFLRQRCTAAQQTVCEDCPPGSFTALWNHISRCLRCGVCGRNMVETSHCSRQRDCDCQCRHGFYYKQRAGMCVRWAPCEPGHGVSTPGTPFENTICVPCANGTFSDQISSESSCSSHKICSGTNEKIIVKGNAWHDTICATCSDARGKEPVDILRTFLPSFFSRHVLSLRRLRHVLSKLPSGGGRTVQRHSLSGLNQDQLQTRLDLWIRDSRPDHLRTLPQILTETGAFHTAERLQDKLGRVKSTLSQICPDALPLPTYEPGLPSSEPGVNQD